MKLSVLMSIYDKESPDFFCRCLESLVEQTLPAQELVLVEDGPLGPELHAAIHTYRKLLPIVSLRLPRNMGLGESLKIGLDACQGELVARMDSDDIAATDRFRRQVAFLDQHPNVDVLGSAISEFNADVTRPHSIRRPPSQDEELVRFARLRTPMNHMTVVFRRASVLRAGSYQSAPGFEDYHLWVRMLVDGYVLHNLEDILVHVRCGNGMQLRRGGLSYLKREIQFQRFLRQTGLISPAEWIYNLATRGTIRLLPCSVRALCYRRFLRENPRTPTTNRASIETAIS